MKCMKKRTIFNLFDVLTCSNCINKKEDEFIMLGDNVIAIYYLFDNCSSLDVDKELLTFDLKKLKLLLKDAIFNQDKIFLLFLEDFKLENFYDVFDKIIDEKLDIQVITL